MHCIAEAAELISLEAQRQMTLQQIATLQAQINSLNGQVAVLDTQIAAALTAYLACEAEHTNGSGSSS